MISADSSRRAGPFATADTHTTNVRHTHNTAELTVLLHNIIGVENCRLPSVSTVLRRFHAVTIHTGNCDVVIIYALSVIGDVP